MNKHTRGPWIAVGTWVEYPNDKIADICTCDPEATGQAHLNRPYAESMANARLIAAAPELLEALVEAYRAYAHDEDGPCWADSTIRKTVAAIKKATDTKNSRFIG